MLNEYCEVHRSFYSLKLKFAYSWSLNTLLHHIIDNIIFYKVCTCSEQKFNTVLTISQKKKYKKASQHKGPMHRIYLQVHSQCKISFIYIEAKMTLRVILYYSNRHSVNVTACIRATPGELTATVQDLLDVTTNSIR